MNERLLSVGELAEALNVPPSWVYGKSRIQGPDAIPMLKVGKYCRFRIKDVLDWLERQNGNQDGYDG